MNTHFCHFLRLLDKCDAPSIIHATHVANTHPLLRILEAILGSAHKNRAKREKYLELASRTLSVTCRKSQTPKFEICDPQNHKLVSGILLSSESDISSHTIGNKLIPFTYEQITP